MISIFAKPPFEMKHLQRVSTTIRGEQIAAYMQETRLNPTSGYENDVCIYVKPYVKREDGFDFEGHPYLDLLDGFELRFLLEKYPEVPVIVFSEIDVETMSRYVKNKIILIPHHHVNFEKAPRTRKGIKVVGIAGSFGAFEFIPKEIRDGLANRNIKLAEHSTFYPRMSVVKFYQGIDVNLVWRPYKKELSNPFKIVNASAFGVPTIALDEPAFKEMDGCYLGVKTAQGWLEKLDALISSQSLYQDISDVCLKKAERYHIENIANLYRKLT